MDTIPMPTTNGSLLGGRVSYAQPAAGYRTGIEPVLLAACIPAKPGQRVLEAGTGAGAALLCLNTRVPGLTGIGIERDPAMATLARHNIAANAAPFTILTTDITEPPPLPPFDHVFANPPWHDPASTQPPDPRRGAATHSTPKGIAVWIDALATLLTPRATLTLILPAALTAEAIIHLHHASLGCLALCPLWPRTAQPAKIVLIQATTAPGPTRITPGLTLHNEGPGYTAAAEAILRTAAPLPI